MLKVKKNIQNIIFFHINLFILLFFWLLWPSKLSPVLIEKEEILEKFPDYSIDDIHYLFMKSFNPVLKLHGKKGKMYFENHFLHIDDISAKIFFKNGEITKANSNSAKIKFNTKELQLLDKVIFKTENKFSIKSDLISYNSKTQYFISPEEAELTFPENELSVRGNSMEGSMENKIYTLKGSVHVNYMPSSKEKLHITSEKATLFENKEKIWMQGIVNLSQDKLDMESQELSLYYNKDNNLEKSRDKKYSNKKLASFRYIVAKGNVRIRDLKNRLSKSEKAEFFSLKDRIVLSGSPVVYSGSNVLTGKTLSFYRGEDMVEIDSSSAVLDNLEGTKAWKADSPWNANEEESEALKLEN